MDGGVIFDKLANSNESHADGVFFLTFFSVQYEFGFWNENVLRVKGGYFKKVTTRKSCQNANFENGGTTIQINILHALLNILSNSLLFRVHDTSGYFEMQKY